MAGLLRSLAQDRILNNPNADEHPSSTEESTSTEKRRTVRDAIQRLEHIVTVQEERMKMMQHRSVGSPSLTRRLRTLMKENLMLYRHTLQNVRQTAHTIERSVASL